ncbi:U1 small nuclear ribonucleoprotein C [Aphelenchoides fujianensis]|nr:U1 small nuclear ribonucleoprotein C [Aphelenchoides fujianensis]
MPKYYCDYCDAFLTHDSPSVRKTHNGGRKHKEHVRQFYQQWMEQQAQKLVDATARAFTQNRMFPQQGPLAGMGIPMPARPPMMPLPGAMGMRPPFPPYPPAMMPRPPGLPMIPMPTGAGPMARPPPHAAPAAAPDVIHPVGLSSATRRAVEMNAARKEIRNLFELYSVDIKRDALDFLTERTKEMEPADRKAFVSNIITNLRNEWVNVQSLDLAKFKELSVATTKQPVQKRDAFVLCNMPTAETHVYDQATKRLISKPRSAVDDLCKYNCLQRRLLTVTNSLDRTRKHQNNVKPIEALFAEKYCEATILAIVRRSGGTSLTAEDVTGSIPVEFTATIQDGWLPFEGGCFLMEGVQQNGLFTIDRVRLPISKPTAQLPQFAVTDAFNRGNMPECGENDQIVFLSDVSRPALNRFFAHFAPLPPDVRSGWACGSWRRRSTISGDFARILSEWSSSFPTSHFVLIPGADDTPGSPISPRYPLLPLIQKLFDHHRNVHFGTNPCTLLFKNRRIVVRRDDVVDKISRSSLHISDQNINISQSYVETIWSQRHLCPVLPAINPVVPHLDDVLLLPNNPDLLILADKCMPFVWNPDEDEAGVCTANPGSFGVNPSQALVYTPRSGEVRLEHLAAAEE